ncbi:MAG: NmrA family NAD(P)-binding protein [Myxococcaceae bacterium]
MPTFLVVGARGRVGREVLNALASKEGDVRALVRQAGTLGEVPGRVKEVVGDLSDARSLAAALEGVQSAFFLTPHTADEEALGVGFIAAARAAGVKRLVFSSATHPEVGNGLGLDLLVLMASVFTHYGPKLKVERAVRRCELSPVVLMPSNFFQNDELLFPEIRAGRYPQPLGHKGVNRVDCADIGVAAARALTDLSLPAGAWPLVGPEAALTGPESAATWAKVLGRPMTYEGDLAQWHVLMKDRMHERERIDFGKSYGLFHRRRVSASPAQIAKCAEILGRSPRSYEDWVRSIAARVTA